MKCLYTLQYSKWYVNIEPDSLLMYLYFFVEIISYILKDNAKMICHYVHTYSCNVWDMRTKY